MAPANQIIKVQNKQLAIQKSEKEYFFSKFSIKLCIELICGNFLENDDMTENSDSGFTEINQTGSNDISQHAKSKTPSPEPDLRPALEPGESSTPVQSEMLDNKSERAASSRSMSKSSRSNSDSSSSDDDDSDDDDYDGGKPSVLNWVRIKIILLLTEVTNSDCHSFFEGSSANVKRSKSS